MNLNELNQKLLAVARHNAPSDHVPYAFEKRIMAHLTARPLPDNILLWGQALWRAVIPCAAVMLLIGIGLAIYGWRRGRRKCRWSRSRTAART